MDILVATIDGGGNLPPLLSVARKLVDRGHRVRVLGEPSSRSDVDATGATFRSWTRAPHRLQRSAEFDLIKDWAEASAQDGALHVIRALICGPSQAFADDVAEELDRSPADLVLSLDMLLGVVVACEARAQKNAVLAPNLSMFPIPGLPPFGTGLPVARTDQDRLLQLNTARAVQTLFDSGLPALNATRVSFGLDPLMHVFDQVGRANAQWLMTSQAFDFPTIGLPERVAYVGPQTADPAWAEMEPSFWPQHDRRPLILVSLSSSFQNQVGTINRIIQALASVDARVIVTLGPALEETQIAPSDHVRVIRSASHEAVMKQASLVVTHGGHGTVIRALRHRLPLLILPHGRDQADNAVRVVERGAGLSLDQSANPDQIRAAVQRLLTEQTFRDNAHRLGTMIAHETERSDIVARVERLVAS